VGTFPGLSFPELNNRFVLPVPLEVCGRRPTPPLKAFNAQLHFRSRLHSLDSLLRASLSPLSVEERLVLSFPTSLASKSFSGDPKSRISMAVPLRHVFPPFPRWSFPSQAPLKISRSSLLRKKLVPWHPGVRGFPTFFA